MRRVWLSNIYIWVSLCAIGLGNMPNVQTVPCMPFAATVGTTVWQIADTIKSVISGSDAFRITQNSIPMTIIDPGYYILVEDITTSGAFGIQILGNGVWIDLRGNTITHQNTANNSSGIVIAGQAYLSNGRVVLENVNNANQNVNCISCVTTGAPTDIGSPYLENIQLVGALDSVTLLAFGNGVLMNTAQAGHFRNLMGQNLSIGIFLSTTITPQDHLFENCIFTNIDIGFSFTAPTDQPFVATCIGCETYNVISAGFAILGIRDLVAGPITTAELYKCGAFTVNMTGLLALAPDVVMRNCCTLSAFNGFFLGTTPTTVYRNVMIDCLSFNNPSAGIQANGQGNLIQRCTISNPAAGGIFVPATGAFPIILSNRLISIPMGVPGIQIDTTAGVVLLDNYVSDTVITAYEGVGIPASLVASTDTELTTANYWFNLARSLS